MNHTFIAKVLTQWYKVEQFFLRLLKLTTAQQIEKYVNTLLPDPADKKKHTIYKALLTNVSKNNIDYSKSHDERFMKFKERTSFVEKQCRTVLIAKLALDKIYEPLLAITGIQPLSGPVGLAYLMQFKDKQETEKGTHQTLEIVSQAVEAASRKLSARLSIEALTDMATTHGLDVQQEMVRAIADIVAFDVFNDVLAKIRTTAPAPTKFKLDVTETNAVQKLLVLISKLSNDIAKETNRGLANVIIINSPVVLAMFQVAASLGQNLSGIKLKDKSTISAAHAPQIISEADSQYTIIYDLGMGGEDIIVAHCGTSGVDTGIIFCPYVLVLESGVQVDPLTFSPGITFVTRRGFAENKNASGYYRVINIVEKDTKKDETK